MIIHICRVRTYVTIATPNSLLLLPYTELRSLEHKYFWDRSIGESQVTSYFESMIKASKRRRKEEAVVMHGLSKDDCRARIAPGDEVHPSSIDTPTVHGRTTDPSKKITSNTEQRKSHINTDAAGLRIGLDLDLDQN